MGDECTTSVLINSTTTINIYTFCSFTFNDDHSFMIQVAGVNSLGLGHMAMIIKYRNGIFWYIGLFQYLLYLY